MYWFWSGLVIIDKGKASRSRYALPRSIRRRVLYARFHRTLLQSARIPARSVPLLLSCTHSPWEIQAYNLSPLHHVVVMLSVSVFPTSSKKERDFETGSKKGWWGSIRPCRVCAQSPHHFLNTNPEPHSFVQWILPREARSICSCNQSRGNVNICVFG